MADQEKSMRFGLGSALDEEPSGEPDADSGADELDAAEQMAADDVMDAMKSGDKSAFRSALKAFVQLCYPED